MEGDVLMFAGYSVPVLISFALGIVFKMVPSIRDRFKTLVAIVVGVVLSIGAMYYNAEPGSMIGFKMYVDYILHGVMLGASATGLYELQRSVVKPRT